MIDPYMLTKEEEAHFSAAPEGFAPCPVCGAAPTLTVARGGGFFEGLWVLRAECCGAHLKQALVSKGHARPEGRMKAIRTAEYVLREWWNMDAERRAITEI